MEYKVSIPISDVEVGMISAEPVYVMDARGSEAMLIRGNAHLSVSVIDRLKKYNIQMITILSDTPPEAETEPEIVIEPPKPEAKIVLNNSLEEPKEKIKPVISRELQVKAVESVETMFSQATETSRADHSAVKEVYDVVDKLIREVTTDIGEKAHLSSLRSYDEYTYHHSLSVAVLSIAIGQEMGLNKWDLQRLGRGAILHDIGKMMVPVELITKTSRLSSEEFDIVKRHVDKGAKYLQINGIGDGGLWEVAMCHHEKIDGSGYHKGMKGKEIPLFSRITSVADVYDALTSNRPYRTPMTPSAAFEMMACDVGRHFDYDVIKAFSKKVSLYPINTIVELSNKELGVVVENTNTMRPILKMLGDGQMLDLSSVANLSLVIEKVIR